MTDKTTTITIEEKHIIKEIQECLTNIGDKSFVYMEKGKNEIMIKGAFSDHTAALFIKTLVKERPKITFSELLECKIS